jgi:hypothetical protein
VLVASITVDDHRLDDLLDDLGTLAPNAFFTVTPLRTREPYPFRPGSSRSPRPPGNHPDQAPPAPQPSNQIQTDPSRTWSRDST